MSTLYEVRQDSLLALGDGNTPANPMLRMGIPIKADKWDLFALMGRMYNLSQAVVGTADITATEAVGAIVLTEPWVRFTVPTGYTVFPRHLNVSLATAAGTANEIALCYSETDSFTSNAGTVLVPVNWRNDNPRASIVTSCGIGPKGTVIVEAALTRVRALYQDVVPSAFAVERVNQYVVDKWWEDLIPIIGPASVLLYVAAATTSSTGYFSLDWAEVPTVAVKAA
jgi:hypothetical protein